MLIPVAFQRYLFSRKRLYISGLQPLGSAPWMLNAISDNSNNNDNGGGGRDNDDGDNNAHRALLQNYHHDYYHICHSTKVIAKAAARKDPYSFPTLKHQREM